MNLLHWMKKENTGLARSTLEICKYEEKAGHKVCIRQPHEDMPIYGIDRDIQIHLIHSQLGQKAYHDGKPKLMWMHGEPLGSVGNGVSMKAILDLASLVDAFIWPSAIVTGDTGKRVAHASGTTSDRAYPSGQHRSGRS